MIGKTLGRYQIIGKLGEGGMGVVYKARDTHLDRFVAIKVLPDEFSHDPERLARFEREAKVLASLNHPNIAVIHGLEESEGKRFIVMELVEGQTLSQRLSKGPLPVEEALEVCCQIAEGLEAAHEKGVIHRDLKSANIQLTTEGKVKILDFGLARAFHDQSLDVDQTHSPTITEAMTGPGVVLGTAASMSPEQAKGKPVDKRADIWAFGCILYECLTGKAPFKGETVTETVAKTLEGSPDWNLLPVATPWRAKELLRRCLQKNPRERLHDIGDARIEIGESVSGLSEVIPVAARSSRTRLLSLVTAALLIGVLGGVLVMMYVRPPALPMAQPVVRASVKLEPGFWLDGMRITWGDQSPTRTAMCLSSDGRFIVYSAIKGNPGPRDKPLLYLRRLDQLAAKPIAGTEGGISPFLSPDDRWVGFWAEGKLMKVPVEGGVSTALCEVTLPYGFSWGTDRQIYFASRAVSGIQRVSADGGKWETLTKPDQSKDESSHRLPFVLPAGKGILFTLMKDPSDLEPRLAVVDLATRKYRVLLENAADGRYKDTGHLVFLRRGTLMAAPFDLNRLEVAGQPVPAVADIMQALNTLDASRDSAAGQFSVSTSGSLAYAPGGILADRENSLVWVDYEGKAEPISIFKAPFFTIRLSPDGKRIAYNALGIDRQIWIYDLSRGTATRITSEGKASWVTWTPDGQRVVFSWHVTGASNLYWQRVDGSSPMERLTTSEHDQSTGSFSPDGQTLLFVEGKQDGDYDIMRLHLRDRKITPFLNSRFSETYPELSPNGRWVAYVSDESGGFEVYVRMFPGPGARTQISNEGGTHPLWSPDGKQLFFRRPNQVWVVDVQTSATFSAGKPRLLFEQAGYATGGPIRCWDISPGGKRFLMIKLEEGRPQPVTELILVQNWFEELKRLVPTGKK